MRPATLYKISAVLLVFFALGHTIGFLRFKPPTAEAIAVRQAMTNVHFQVKGSDFSYAGFYEGFGLFVTAYLLFSAFLAWHLAKRPDRTIGWAFCAVQIASLVLSWMYFSVAPAAFSAVIAACLGWAAMKSQTVTLS